MSARLRDLRKPQWGGHVVERNHLGDGHYEYRLTASEHGLLDGDRSDAPWNWHECDPIRFCVQHGDFHPPVPTALPNGYGCIQTSWRRVKVLCEGGQW